MLHNIKDVIVNRISLVSKWKRPAVAKAETSFSIFKTAKTKLSQEQIAKLEDISKAYEKKTLYVSRSVTNAKDIIKWAKAQGIKDLIKADEMHVTIAFSKKKVVWSKLTADDSSMEISLENAKVQKLGDAIVIKFANKDLKAGWKKYIDAGASWDFETYQPHISVSYNADQDISKVGTFSGAVSLGGEIMAEVKAEFVKKLERIATKYAQMLGS